MSAKPVTRNHNMADGDEIQKADSIATAMKRDHTEFATRGVDATRAKELTDARDAFADYPTDEELAGIITDASEKKDAQRAQIEYAVASIRNMADVKYNGHGLYKTFGFNGFSNLSDSDMHRATKRIVRVSTKLKTALATEGLTTTNITDLQTLNQSFDDSIDAVHDAEEERDLSTQKRVLLSNALWDKMSEFASIGKSLFEHTDEAKYNDYVITDAATPQHAPHEEEKKS